MGLSGQKNKNKVIYMCPKLTFTTKDPKTKKHDRPER